MKYEAKPAAPPRSPVVAALLSLIIPGAGQIFARRVARGLGILLTIATMVGLMFWARDGELIVLSRAMQGVLWALIAALWVWNVLDASRAAQQRSFSVAGYVLILVLFSYLLGWVITEMDMRKFVTEFPRTFQIMARIAWPWEAAFQRETETVQAIAEFGVPCPDEGAPEAAEPIDGEPWLSVTPTCGAVSNYTTEGFQPGTEITLIGGGFAPNTYTEIWWSDPIGNEFRPTFSGQRVEATTDENGAFEVTFLVPQVTIPSVAVGVQWNDIQARQVAEVGDLKPTSNLRLAFARIIETIFLALVATTIGIVFAIPVSFLAAHNLMSGSPLTLAIYYFVRAAMNIFRSIEPLIWAVIGVAWVGLGPFAGVIALTVHTVASLGKLYSEAIESIDLGPIEAIQSTGATWIQRIAYAVIPQVVPPFLSFTIYRWDINVRMSTIIGAVGGGGIGFLLFQWIRLTDWDNAGIAVWMIAITVMILDYASAEFRKRLI